MPPIKVSITFFFQYYLSPGHLFISTFDQLPERLSFDELTSRGETDEPGDSWSTYHINTEDPDGDKYLVLALKINQTNYNKLHDRVLEVRTASSWNDTLDNKHILRAYRQNVTDVPASASFNLIKSIEMGGKGHVMMIIVVGSQIFALSPWAPDQMDCISFK